jgi:hypothetical protein
VIDGERCADREDDQAERDEHGHDDDRVFHHRAAAQSRVRVTWIRVNANV